MRISDWSSDVCSSDLSPPRSAPAAPPRRRPCRPRRVPPARSTAPALHPHPCRIPRKNFARRHAEIPFLPFALSLSKGRSFLRRCTRRTALRQAHGERGGRENSPCLCVFARAKTLSHPQQRLLFLCRQPAGPRHLAPQRHPILGQRRHPVHVDAQVGALEPPPPPLRPRPPHLHPPPPTPH